jgi:hypothetical protein
MSLITIQDRYIGRVLEAEIKWSHRKSGGHMRRTRRAAYTEAKESFLKLGFSLVQIVQIVSDANDVVILELNAE